MIPLIFRHVGTRSLRFPDNSAPAGFVRHQIQHPVAHENPGQTKHSIRHDKLHSCKMATRRLGPPPSCPPPPPRPRIFYRRAASTADTTQTFEYSDNLTGWNPVAIPGGTGVVVTDIGGGIDEVVVTVPRGPNTTLFGRLAVTKP